MSPEQRRPEDVDLEVGLLVVSEEGRPLGTIIEIHTEAIRVDDPVLGNTWYERDVIIGRRDDGCVVCYVPPEAFDQEQVSERDRRPASASNGEEHFELQAGMPVVTSDGEGLGTIKEIRTDRFKVDAPMSLDYWLDRETVAGMTADGYIVNFERDRLDEMKRSDPGAPGATPATSLQDSEVPKKEGDETPPSHT